MYVCSLDLVERRLSKKIGTGRVWKIYFSDNRAFMKKKFYLLIFIIKFVRKAKHNTFTFRQHC